MTDASIDRSGVVPRGADGLTVPRADNDGGRGFIGLTALGTNSRKSYAIGLLRIVFYYIGYSALGIAWVLIQYGRHIPPFAMVILGFGAVIASGAAVIQTVARTHKRPWQSVLSSSLAIDWRRVAIGIGVQAVLVLAILLLAHLTGLIGDFWRLPKAEHWLATVLALLLVPLQAASEELVFRGYLTQALGRICRNRVIIVAVVGLLFALVHFNVYGPLTTPYMFGISVLFSLVTLRDGGLELAIGAHIAQNWLSIGEIDAMNSHAALVQITWPYLIVLVVQGALFYGATQALVRRLDRHKATQA
jgi:membrane protease YdiL (CAAX protease family)